MMRSFRLNNKGAALLLISLLSLIMLAVIAGVLFSRTVGENLLVKNEQISFEAQYAAEQGAEAVYLELLNAPFRSRWYTHEVPNFHFGDNTLDQANPPVVSTADLVVPNTMINTLGEYASTDGSNVSFIAKIYNDPSTLYSGREKIILIKGFSSDGRRSRLLAVKASMHSLFEYFMFAPTTGINFEGGTFDAGGGKIHSEGGMQFYSGAEINNVSQLSTSGGSFFYYTYPRRPPLWIDPVPGVPPPGMITDADGRTLAMREDTGSPDGTTWAEIFALGPDFAPEDYWQQGWCGNAEAFEECSFDVQAATMYPDTGAEGLLEDKFIHQSTTGRLMGDRYGAICYNPNVGYETSWDCAELWGTYEAGAIWDMVDPDFDTDSARVYMYDDYGSSTELNSSAATIQPVGADPVKLPNRLLDSPYRRPKYYTDQNQEGYRREEHDGEHYVYPANTGAGAYDPEDMEGTCSGEVCPDVTYLNSLKQPESWSTFLQDTGLYGTVMDANTGAPEEGIAPPRIDADALRDLAMQDGIRIINTVDSEEWNDNPELYYENPDFTLQDNGSYQVIIKGQIYMPNPEGKIIVNIPGLGSVTLFEKIGFYRAIDTHYEQSVKIDVGNLKAAMAEEPDNFATDINFAYSDYPVALVNGESLPEGGWSVVSDGAVYITGNYNTVDYQPAMVLTPVNKTYLLGPDYDFPDYVPYTLEHVDENYNMPDGEQDWWNNNYNDQKPSEVNEDMTYRVSIIGYNAAKTTWLRWENSNEIWSDWNGGPDRPWITKEIAGTLYRLPYDPSASPGDEDYYNRVYDYGGVGRIARRKCTGCNGVGHTMGIVPDGAGYAVCRGCSEWCFTPGEGVSATNIGSLCDNYDGPQASTGTNSTTYSWEPDYMNGNLPPPDLAGMNFAAWMLLADTQENFNNHLSALQSEETEIIE